MNFTRHSEVKGMHALFSPSQSSWLRYGDEQIANRIRNRYKQTLGTELHEYVATQIKLSHKVTNIRALISGFETFIFQKYQLINPDNKSYAYGMNILKQVSTIPREAFETAKNYINDGIGFRMEVEQPLVYSEFFFGTADTISFRDNELRIHDYKSGDHPAAMDQLMVYASLFCLEYEFKPKDIRTELRIYQFGEYIVCNPVVDDLEDIMGKIIYANKLAEKIKAKEDWK